MTTENRSNETAGMFKAVTVAATDFANTPCRSIMCDAAGTLTITDAVGGSHTVVVVAGNNPYQTKRITAASGPTAITVLF